MSEREGDSLTLRDFEAFVRESREAFLTGLLRLQEKLMETTLGKQRWREIARYRIDHSPGGAQLSYEEFLAHQVTPSRSNYSDCAYCVQGNGLSKVSKSGRYEALRSKKLEKYKASELKSKGLPNDRCSRTFTLSRNRRSEDGPGRAIVLANDRVSAVSVPSSKQVLSEKVDTRTKIAMNREFQGGRGPRVMKEKG